MQHVPRAPRLSLRRHRRALVSNNYSDGIYRKLCTFFHVYPIYNTPIHTYYYCYDYNTFSTIRVVPLYVIIIPRQSTLLMESHIIMITSTVFTYNTVQLYSTLFPGLPPPAWMIVRTYRYFKQSSHRSPHRSLCLPWCVQVEFKFTGVTSHTIGRDEFKTKKMKPCT